MPKSYSKQFSLYDSGLVLSTVEQLPTASASVAFTVDSGKVFRVDGEIVPVTLSNGIQYMPWSGDNLLPYHVLDMIESDETLSTCQIFFEHQTTWVVTRNVKNASEWNKCILTRCFSISATVAPIYPRVFPTSVIEISISQIDFPTSQVEYADFQQKRG